jgi:hypothetical protein
MEVMVVSVLMYMGSLLILRGYWRPATAGEPTGHGAPAHAAGGR